MKTESAPPNTNTMDQIAPSRLAVAGSGTGCVVCGLDQDADKILLCDGCDAEYHTTCLVPPLNEIPEGDFYCKSCKDAKRNVKSPASTSSASVVASASNGATQAGFAVQDEHGRIVPVRSDDVRESKYKGVLKLLTKGTKKPFVARVHKDGKYMQLGIYGSEIEAAHACDKASIELFGRAAELNFPHLHDGFMRGGATADTAAKSPASSVVAIAPAVAAGGAGANGAPGFGTPGRGRGRGGRGGRGSRGGAVAAGAGAGGGRGKRRLEEFAARAGESAGAGSGGPPIEKKRKALAVATGTGAGVKAGDVPVLNGPKYLGVQVYRSYSHAQIAVNGKTVNLGTFPTPVDAAIAYDKAALKYFGGEIGSKDALHDRVVLNFPNKRAELLKQLIEESMHQKARQAGGGGSGSQSFGGASAANRSMQSAKHNLSIKKLENWLLKLQRSVKLVEAAHRVQWDGLPLVKPETSTDSSVAHGHDGENVADQDQDMKLELLAGAGPTIKTDFTKKQQRLRASACQIQNAVDLMVQELKIYADDAPMDVAFQPPPRSHALLDLMSTSRFLKLCSTINELAHSNATASATTSGTGDHDDNSKPMNEDDTFAALVQTVVDYRTRLQMAASAEKQKLAGLVEPSDVSSSVPSDTTSGAAKSPVAAAIGTTEVDAISREILNRAKYVKRKVQRIRTVKKTRVVPLAIEAAAQAEDEEKKEEEEEHVEENEKTTELKIVEPSTAKDVAAKTATKQPESAAEAEADVEAVPEAMDVEASSDAVVESSENVEAAVAGSEATALDTKEKKPDADDVTTVEADAKMDASEKETSAADASEKSTATVSETVTVKDAELTSTEPGENGASEAEPPVGEEPQESSKTEDDGDQVMESVEPLAESEEPSEVSASTEDATTKPMDDVSTEAAAVAEVDDDEEEETIVEDDWEFCLALKAPATSSRASVDATDKDTELWRLLPIESERGEFVADVLLTDDQVAEIEVTEREVCGGGSASWKPQLSELHQREITLRERVKNEMDRRQALESVIKIEQERLSQVFVVYRRMLEGVVAKSTEVQKRHQRITRDLLLVELMKQTFAPILDDLLQQCESVFVERLEKMADRFDDFQQEFEYYTDALLSVVGCSASSATGQSNGHTMKDEELPDASTSLAAVATAEIGDGDGDDAMDGESSGLRGAYVSFYMEEIETLWKERCRAVESLYAILRSLTVDNAPAGDSVESAESAPVVDVNGTALLRRRVHENLDQWKEIKWPAQLATPPFVASFMKDSSSRGTGVASLLPVSSSQQTSEQEAVGRNAMGELKQIIIDLTQESPLSVTSQVVRHSTLVVYHPVFLEHQTPKDHPECPERLNRIVTMLNSLRKKFDDSVKIDRLTQSPEELSPSDSTLLAVHSPAYLQQLKHRASEASANGELGLRRSVTLSTSSSLAASALVFETNRGVLDLAGPKPKAANGSDLATRASPTGGSMGGAFGASNLVPTGIAMDTYVSSKSWDVARAAAGTVCLAVDRVVRKEFRNAACLVRPPGHHVGRHGRTLDAPSSGFCLLNNVVIGAVHARQYPWIRRVAVLDWDIHHGNGTEELMRDDPDGFFASIHLYASGKFFPGTGKSEQNGNLVNVALENTGAGSGSAAFRSALQDQILPAMRAFQPDIIFISAGFDGHKDDILGGRAAVKNTAVPAGYLEDDYVWATQEVLTLADECCDGRVVSVLEGGYDVRRETNSLAKSVAAHVGAIASYEQEKQAKQQHVNKEIPMAVETIKSDMTPTGVLLALLAKDLNDDDVVIIDDDEEDDDAEAAGMDKSGGSVLPSAETHEHEHDEDEDVEDDEDDEEEDGDGDAEDMEGDGVEVEDEEDDDHHHDGHGHHDDLDVDDDDVVMTEDHHDGDHSVDEDDDGDSAGLSFAASLSVDGDDGDDHHHEDHHHHGDGASRIETPDYNHLDAGTGEEEEEEGDDDDDDDMNHGGHNDDGDEEEDDDEDRDGDLLGHGGLPSLS